MTYPTVPEGYRRLAADEVWTDGTDVIVLGLPPNADADDNKHNCDAMGCGQCHVLLKAEDVEVGFDFSALPKEKR